MKKQFIFTLNTTAVSLLGHLLAPTCSLAQEGFFSVSSPSPSGISRATIEVASKFTGAFARRNKEIVADPATEFNKRCAQAPTREWHQNECKQLQDSCLSAKKSPLCLVEVDRLASGVVLDGGIFVTVAHAQPGLNPFLKIKNAEDGISEYPLQKIQLKDLPFDLAAYSILGWSPTQRGVALGNSDTLPADAPVFSLGFPDTALRTRGSSAASWAQNELKVTYGKITNGNRERWSYCHYSNQINIAEPENWKLEADCAIKGPHPAQSASGTSYSARLEKNVLLTDTDMINGMSGAPLFSADGALLGIGSTVLKNGPPLNYEPGKFAVYVKTESIREALGLAP